MKHLKKWLKAFRLRTLPLSLSAILMGNLLVDKSNFSVSILILTLITTILLQVLSNLANDLGDSLKGTDNENRIGPTRSIQSGELTILQMKKAVFINSILAFLSGCWLLYLSFDNSQLLVVLGFLILGITCIGAAIKYTMGKRPYGYAGWGDLSVFIFFGIIGVGGSFFLQEKTFYWPVLLPCATIGLLSAAVLNMNNMRDIDNDLACGKLTLAAKLGLRRSKHYHSFLILGSLMTLVFSLIFFAENPVNYLALIIYSVLIVHLIKVWKTTLNEHFDPELKKIALSTFALPVIWAVTFCFF